MLLASWQAPMARSGSKPSGVIALPIEQTVGGVTVRVIKARWCDPGEVEPQELGKFATIRRGLGLWFEMPEPIPGVRPAPGQKLTDYIRSIKALGPWAEHKFQFFPERRAAWCEDVDPRWKKFAVELEFLDPGAPPDAPGEWTHSLQFRNVPLPDKPNKPLAVNRVLTTPRGTRAILEKIALQPDEKQLVIVLRLAPPTRVPDMLVNFVADEYHFLHVLPVITDDQGKDLTSARLETEPMDALTEYREDWEWPVTIKTAPLPSPGARTINVGIQVHEIAPSLKQPQWFRRFRFELATADIKQILRVTPWTGEEELALTNNAEIDAALEALTPHWDDFLARFWWRERPPAQAGAHLKWQLKKVTARDATGTEVKILSDPWPLLWKADGSIPPPHEQGAAIILGAAPRDRKLSFRGHFRLARTARTVLDFAALPLPAPGETIKLNLVHRTVLGTRLVLRQISYLKARQKMPGLTELEVENLTLRRHAGALAFVFEWQARSNGEFNLSCVRANDEKGRDLNLRWQSQGIRLPGPAGRIQRPVVFRIVLGLLPPVGARRCNARFVMEEAFPTGRTATLKWPTVLVRASKSAGFKPRETTARN